MAPTSNMSFPPFPEGLNLAPIAVISSRRLLDSDPEEGARVLDATKTYGFFYLNLNDSPEGEAMIDESAQLLALSRTAFGDLSLEEKLKHRRDPGALSGYKEAGTVKSTDKDARPDTTEFWMISKDHINGFTPSRSYPAVLEEAKPLLKSFTKHGHDCGLLVQRTLARQLGLPKDTFADQNVFEKPSGDHIRMTRKVPHPTDSKSIGLPSHTDFGCVTVLFNWQGGLQIESRTEGRVGEWEWVKPMPGHAIINLGDAMVNFTNGELKSAKHRVVPAPGEQGKEDRYSLVYFVRPHDEAIMRPLDRFATGERVKVAGKFSDGNEQGKLFTAAEWMHQRTLQLIGK